MGFNGSGEGVAAHSNDCFGDFDYSDYDVVGMMAFLVEPDCFDIDCLLKSGANGYSC